MAEKRYERNAVRLGQLIREHISMSGMNQVRFAFSLGVSPSRLSNYLTGARLPDFFTLCRIADILNVSLDDLNPDNKDRADQEVVYSLKICGKCTVRLEKTAGAD
ncbi:MAG: helix-turn-helix domain-containing protein [Deferribacterales bacterium]